MKVTKERSAKNRAALIRAAGSLFREHGFDGVGVAEISEAAGLTHGALYAQFSSKEDLAAEALSFGLERGFAKIMALKGNDLLDISACLDYLLSPEQRDDLARGCPITASGSDIARQSKVVSACFAEGIERLVTGIESLLRESAIPASARERALTIVAAEVGAIVIARGVAKAHAELSEELLVATRRVLGHVGGEANASP